jgi:hypothetical protein
MLILMDDTKIMDEWNCITEWVRRNSEVLGEYWNVWPRIHRLIQERRSVEVKMQSRVDNPKFWGAA